MAAENYRQLGDTSVFINEDCRAEVRTLTDAKAQIPLTELTCGGACRLGESGRGVLFGVPLNAPEGNVSDPYIQAYLERSCPLSIIPEVAETEPVTLQTESPQAHVLQTQLA